MRGNHQKVVTSSHQQAEREVIHLTETKENLRKKSISDNDSVSVDVHHGHSLQSLLYYNIYIPCALTLVNFFFLFLSLLHSIICMIEEIATIPLFHILGG